MTAAPRFLFRAWRGAYADNPRAVAEALGRYLPAARQSWVSDGSSPIPQGVARLSYNSPNYFLELMRTAVLVSNDLTVRFPPRRKPLLYVQTWHGTPLKRIGWDAASGPYGLSEWYLKKQDEDVARWDLLISPSPEITEILRAAFHYEGAVIECGYPRNDLLVSNAGSQSRLATRQALGISNGMKALLYAPTWRAGGRTAVRPELDWPFLDEAFLQDLPDDVIVLARLHPIDVERGPGLPQHPRLMDASRYPDVRDLLNCADLLVTDYSSLMFDFAVTGRPMVFYAYDLDHYSEQERGFYFDYEHTVPGPVVSGRDELIEVLRQVLRHGSSHRLREAEFRARFCSNEDGRATGRLLEDIQHRLLDEGIHFR